ncbi:MAG TPA: murein biosynthesis integral membrane protein MurJ [Phycisphaerae bacterium]|nr:murein biosynthesis integral membrane protein MurJ [Phycisphaerae bacterium]
MRSARVISVLTIVSRIAGLARDMVFSYRFGTGSEMSAFTLAFQIPNLFRRLFGEGALSAASIPVLTETLRREGASEMNAVVGRLIGLLMAVLIVLCVVAELVVAGLYLLYQSRSDTALALELSAVLMPFMILICTSAILGGIENVHGRFALPASMPTVINLVQIGAALAAPYVLPGNVRGQLFMQCGSVLVGGGLTLWLQWRAVRRCGVDFRLRIDWRHPVIRRIGLTMIPMVVGLGAVQVNVFMDSMIAWWFVHDPPIPELGKQRPGAAVLYYAAHLYQFPLGVFLVALATAIFPELSKCAADRDMPGLRDTLARGIRVALFISIPCMVGMILVREPMVRVLFAHGKFNLIPHAAERVALALAMFVSALWAYGLNHLVTRTFYSLQDAKTPLKVAVSSVVLNLVLNLILVQTPLREAGLALSTAISATFQFVVMTVVLRRRIGRMGWRRTIPSAFRILLASGVMAAAVIAMDQWALAGMHDAVRLAAMVAVGAVVFIAAALLLRCDEFHDVIR